MRDQVDQRYEAFNYFRLSLLENHQVIKIIDDSMVHSGAVKMRKTQNG